MEFLRFIAAAVACSTALACSAGSTLVLYFNESGDRVEFALSRLRAELVARGVTARHSVVVEHVAVNYSDLEEIRRQIRQADARKPAAIIAAAGPTALIAKEEGISTPVIFGMHQDPVELGIVKSMRHPGGGMTGLTLYRSDESKRLELLRQLAPNATRVGVLIDGWWDRGPHYRHPSARVLEPKAAALGFRVEYFQVDTLADLHELPANARARGMDAWYVPGTQLGFDRPAEVARLIESFSKPAIYALTIHAENGGLIAYQTVFENPFRSWAEMLELVLDGFPPGEIPIERPRAFEMSINLDTARTSPARIPKSILLQATRFY